VYTGGTNRAVITGAGSRWACTSTLNVGNSGSYNTLLITNGGRVDSPSGVVGNASIGNLALVTGDGSLWNCTSGLFVGQNVNSNQLIVADGADVISSGAYVGGNFAQSGSGRSNSVVLTGAGSTWTNTSSSSVGNFGAFNRLTITNGAVMRNTASFATLVLGWQPSGSNNTLVVTGTNSLFSNRGTSGGVAVGQGGPFNEMQIRNGGCVDGDTGSVGANVSASNNVVVVADPGSRWLSAFSLELGTFGSGNQLWLTNGGWVQAGSMTLGKNLGSSNSLLFVHGGTLTVTNASNNAAPDIRGGTNVLNGGLIEADILRMTNGILSRLEVNGGTFTVKSSRVLAGNPVNIGDGVSPATLFLAGNGTHDFTGTLGLIISNNATLTGNGSLLVQLQVRSGATLSPGAPIGKISVSTSPFLSGATVMEISRSGSVLTNDQFQVTGALTYGGSLVVSNLGPTALTNGDNFKLFAATSYAGAFSTLNLPVLGPNLTWTNKLLVDGSIEVLSVPPRDFGVDVSHFQGETGVSQSSWNQMFTAGKRFVFIKATEGLTVLDAAMENNANRATAAGLRAGVYHFAHPELRPTTNGAIQEADYLLSYAGNFVGPGYLRPVLDLEFNAATLSTADLTDWVIAFANEIIAQRGPGRPRSFIATRVLPTTSLTAVWPVTICGCGRSRRLMFPPTNRRAKASSIPPACSTTGLSGNTATPETPAASARST
jgi:T5SS/PEP-CTERM-associated repeat protein